MFNIQSFDLPFCEPSLIEGKADIDSENVFLDQARGAIVDILGTDVKKREEQGSATDVTVGNGNTKADCGTDLTGTCLTVYFIIRCGIACTKAIMDALEDVPRIPTGTIFTT